MGLEGGFRKHVERVGRVLALAGAFVALPHDSVLAREVQQKRATVESLSPFLGGVNELLKKGGFSAVVSTLAQASSSVDMRGSADVPGVASMEGCQGAYVRLENSQEQGAYFVTANHCLDVPNSPLPVHEFTRHTLSDLAVKWEPSYAGKTLVLSATAKSGDFAGMIGCVVSTGVKKESEGMPCGLLVSSGSTFIQSAFNEKRVAVDAISASIASSENDTLWSVFPKQYGLKDATDIAPLNGFSGGAVVACSLDGACTLAGTMNSFVPSNNEAGTVAFFAGPDTLRAVIASERAKYPTSISLK